MGSPAGMRPSRGGAAVNGDKWPAPDPTQARHAGLEQFRIKGMARRQASIASTGPSSTTCCRHTSPRQRSTISGNELEIMRDEDRPRPRSRRSSAIRSTICACTVTSSAVVSSSAISKRGRPKPSRDQARAGACPGEFMRGRRSSRLAASLPDAPPKASAAIPLASPAETLR